jgi:membrane fusion protein (multidrug efflux system)
MNPQIEYVGQTMAVDTVDLRARVQAFLTRRTFKEGDDVKEGALLFILEREPFEAAVDAAAARVAQARAEVVRTRRDLERTRTLYARGNVSQQSLDRAISDQDQAEATLRASEAQLRQAQIDLGYTQITAPFDGRIGRSVYSVGQWVGPDSGVLATLVKLDPIYVVFNASERSYLDYQRRVEEAVRSGRPRPEFVPRLRLSTGAEYPQPGQFDFVDNRVDPSTGTIAVKRHSELIPWRQ